MKKLTVLVMLGLALCATNAMAYLYLPDVDFAGGNATYNAQSQQLNITGNSQFVQFNESEDSQLYFSHIPSTIDDISFSSTFSGMSGDNWSFVGNGANSLVVKGKISSDYASLIPAGFDNTSGVMITGSITDLWFNPTIGRIGGLFTITGGALMDYYASVDYIGMFEINLERYLSSPIDQFSNWQSASAKGDISPVPEPATMTLFGLGLIGMIGALRSKFANK